MSESPRIHVPTTDWRNEIRACPLSQFQHQDIVWSRRTALLNSDLPGVDLSAERGRQLNDFQGAHTSACGFHVGLMALDPEPPRVPAVGLAGSGTLVRVDDHVGILSASHVFAEKGLEGDRFPAGGQAVWSNLDRGKSPGGLVPTEQIWLSGGVAHLPHREPSVPGLPDIAFFILNDPCVVEKFHPRAFPLDEAHCCLSGDELLLGLWFITGARGERSGPNFVYNEQVRGASVDRIYERARMRFLSSFVDPADEPRRNWGGFSGGGVWNQRLTRLGFDKLRHGASLSRDDLGDLRLVGVPFFHSAVPPHGPAVSSENCRGELIAHHLTPELVRGFRSAVLGQADEVYRHFRSPD